MTHKNVKAPLVPANEARALDFVVACPALNDRETTPALHEIQCLFIARRTRLAPGLARLVAELAFVRRAA